MDWIVGLISAIGQVAGGVIEESSNAALESDKSNEDAQRAAKSGQVIRKIFNFGRDDKAPTSSTDRRQK